MFLILAAGNSTETKRAGAKMRRAAAAAPFNERQTMTTDTMREALETLIFYVEQAQPDMPDTARIDSLALALDNARQNLPMAAAGLQSYRYRTAYGWVMIGATDDADALREAQRSTPAQVSADRLQRWTGTEYQPTKGQP
jgi:hypothetical protein